MDISKTNPFGQTNKCGFSEPDTVSNTMSWNLLYRFIGIWYILASIASLRASISDSLLLGDQIKVWVAAVVVILRE